MKIKLLVLKKECEEKEIVEITDFVVYNFYVDENGFIKGKE